MVLGLWVYVCVNHYSRNTGNDVAYTYEQHSLINARKIKWWFSQNSRVRAQETGSVADQATWPNPSISVKHAYYLYAYGALRALFGGEM